VCASFKFFPQLSNNYDSGKLMTSKTEDQNFLDFGDYPRIAKKYWLPMLFVSISIFGLSIFFTFIQKPIYQAEGKLRFNKVNNISSLSGITEKAAELSGLTNLSNPLETEAEVIRSNPLVEKTISVLNLRDKKDKPLEVEDFLQKIKIKAVKDTDILELMYSSTNPKEASLVVNTLMTHYLENNIRTNRAEAKAAREFLTTQLPQLERQVSQSEMAVRKFKEKNKIVVLEEEAKAGIEELKNLSQEISKAKSELAAANIRSQTLQEQLELNTKQAVNLSTLSQSPAVQQVLTEYQKVQDQLAVERSRYTDQHPSVINLERKEESLKRQLELRVGQNIDNINNTKSISEKNLQLGELRQSIISDLVKYELEKLGLQKKVTVLNNDFYIYKGRLNVLPKLEQEQRELERKLQVAQFTYQQLLKQLQEVQVIENQNVGNAKIISEARIPRKPVSPNFRLNLALGGLLGILLGVGTVLILEATNKSVKTVEEAKRLLDYPFLGTIPLLDKKSASDLKDLPELTVLNHPYSGISSSFEMVQNNLGLSVSDKSIKVIVVSSSIPGEGKSFVCANLAVTMAQLGRKVLLIDGDMRRPRQQEVWELMNSRGLSNVLVGQVELENAVQEALVTMEVLTSGALPPNPLALLDSQKMENLVQEVSERYDFVIIDTPPLNVVADPLTIGKFVDGILLVVRPGVATRETITTAKSLLEQSGTKVLGMIANGITTESGYGGYYYGKYGNKYYSDKKIGKDEGKKNFMSSTHP
jgi:polysaccharide biosynthesis transport protein